MQLGSILSTFELTPIFQNYCLLITILNKLGKLRSTSKPKLLVATTFLQTVIHQKLKRFHLHKFSESTKLMRILFQQR